MQKIILEHSVCDDLKYCQSDYEHCLYKELKGQESFCTLFRTWLDKDTENNMFVKCERCQEACRAAFLFE